MVKTRTKKIIATVALLLLGFSIVFFVMMLLSIVTDYGITIASFGATVLMIFSRKTLQHRKIIGAYLLASIIGCIGSMLPTMASFNLALASILSFAVMTLLDVQHAPAIGLAISMALNKFSIWTDIIVAVCIFIIIGMALLLKAYLRDPDRFLKMVNIETEKINWNF
jgi:CBS-domain-containing membrane protein